MEEVTDLDMEVARQLVQLSEGETTTMTATTSSSGSCNSNFYTFDNNVVEGVNNAHLELNKKRNNDNNNNENNVIIIEGGGKEVDNKVTSLELSWLGPVAGELEDDEEEDVDCRRKKTRRYRSIVELYRATKVVTLNNVD